MRTMKRDDVLRLVASIIFCQLAGFIGSLFTAPSIPTWYETLQKPYFTPPNWIFAPVWISLYILMGISLFIIWQRWQDNSKAKTALAFFFVQLTLNILWSISFFGFKSTLAGFIDIVLLWIAILLTIWYFLKVSKIAGLLLFPYVLWVSFAAFLNFSLWIQNR